MSHDLEPESLSCLRDVTSEVKSLRHVFTSLTRKSCLMRGDPVSALQLIYDIPPPKY